MCIVPAMAAVQLDSTPPADAPYQGGYWITGNSSLGVVDVYIPNPDGWCIDSSGYLFRYVSNSVNGIMVTADGKRYTFRAPAFSTPQYRPTDSNYSYTDIFISPTGGNVIISNSFEPTISVSSAVSYISIFILGVILVVLISKRR